MKNGEEITLDKTRFDMMFAIWFGNRIVPYDDYAKKHVTISMLQF
jgi:hypothetical protein